MPPAKKVVHSGGVASLIRDAGQQARSTVIEPGLVPLVPVPGAPAVTRTGRRIFNVIEYVESSWGVGMRLYPVQRFIVKLYYHIPLDDREKTINISDMFNQEIVYRFTEKEYLKYLFDEGRCNIEEQDHDRRELVLAIGRRGGKTMLSSLFASYEIYRLLNLENPQEPGRHPLQRRHDAPEPLRILQAVHREQHPVEHQLPHPGRHPSVRADRPAR